MTLDQRFGLPLAPREVDVLLAHTVVVLDWVGTLAFALSGGMLGVRKGFDLFGVLFLAFVVSVAGGMMRDVLIGATPPAALTQVHYFVISVAAGLIAFYWAPRIALWHRGILLLDAIGLALFAVVGTQKAVAYGIHPAMAALMGMLTGIGGGMLRDVLARDTPFVLRGDLYAVAALAGGVVVAIGHAMHGPQTLFTLLGAAVCVFLRLMAIYRGWRAPLSPVTRDQTP
jgi:uncharacterized membrane protein YeiH